MTTDYQTDANREERIRHHAYMLWLAEGQPDGRADEHWRLATEATAESVGDLQLIHEEGSESAVGSASTLR